MSTSTGATLVVSLLPRGAPSGLSALIALDAATLEPLAYRELPPDEFARDPTTDEPTAIQHCRGIAQAADRLFAALFNAVREYAVEDVRRLQLRPLRLLTDPRAVDLHGIDVHDGRLVAASTGSDALIAWDLASGKSSATVLGNGQLDGADLRFPDRRALRSGHDDWRDCVPGRDHLNDVCLHDGAVVVCRLGGVGLLARKGWEPLLGDPGARFHDGRFAEDGSLLLTDASRGQLVALDVAARHPRRLTIADPSRSFVRGLGIAGGLAYVLRSSAVVSRQRDPRRLGRATSAGGARFGILVVDLAAWRVIQERTVELPCAAAGTVAYKVLPWTAAHASRGASEPAVDTGGIRAMRTAPQRPIAVGDGPA